MSTMEYPPEDREPTPRGASKAAEVEESRADMWCMCAIEARANGEAEPHWYFERGYYWCSVPELPGHDVSGEPPTTTGLIPCQPVFPWNPAEHPDLAQRTAAQLDLQRTLDENGGLL